MKLINELRNFQIFLQNNVHEELIYNTVVKLKKKV